MSKNSYTHILPEERERRQQDVNAALASVRLEGFTVPEAYKAEAERFIAGEIEFDELTAFVHRLAAERRANT